MKNTIDITGELIQSILEVNDCKLVYVENEGLFIEDGKEMRKNLSEYSDRLYKESEYLGEIRLVEPLVPYLACDEQKKL